MRIPVPEFARGTRGTPAGTFVSMGVFTERGRYGIADGIVFSLPCISDGDGEWRVVSNLVFP